MTSFANVSIERNQGGKNVCMSCIIEGTGEIEFVHVHISMHMCAVYFCVHVSVNIL